ncbi:MAG: outer membrane beta-barrel protein [Dyadobacter sp.]|uniref:outer membrane beta-barrel protein n=1 Tax=Dyadobacter sp. TaxID=1914288 RepID=UPI00326659E5
MKKSLLPLLSFLLVANMVQAQNSREFRRFGVGVYAGPQFFGKIYDNDKVSNVSGLASGLDLSYAFSKQPQGFSLHFQPGYNSFKYFATKGANSPFYLETTWRWKAFHFPLLLRYTFTSGMIRPFAEVGPTLRLRKALTIREYGYACGFAGCSGNDITNDLQSETNKDPIIITAAAGVEIDIWKITIPVSIRLQEGIRDYGMKDYSTDGAYYDGLKTRTIQVTAGISF